MSMRGTGVRRTAPRLALSVGCALALAAMIGPAAAESATSHTQTYSTPGVYTFTVPNDVVSVTVNVIGAAGGACSPFVAVDPDAGSGGKGAGATATLAVKPGSKLLVGVGGTGGVCTPGPSTESPVTAALPEVTGGGGIGGVNGGADGGPTPAAFGASGAGGGGASGVLASLTSPLVVAGGGGGAAYCGGNGGNADSAGTSGQTDCEGTNAAGGGGGAGTVTAGGAGGAAGDSNASPGDAGTTENGGAGGAGWPFASFSGGGGGGGLNGGGGGGGGDEAYGGGGGGGGASFVIPAATKVTAPTPTTAPAGVTITYKAVPPKATTDRATGVRQTSCTLHGTVNGEGLKTTYWFQWGVSKSYGHKTASHMTAGKSKSVSALITHLKAGTTYHFRVVAKTASGTGHGKDMTCTTLKAKVKPVFTG